MPQICDIDVRIPMRGAGRGPTLLVHLPGKKDAMVFGHDLMPDVLAEDKDEPVEPGVLGRVAIDVATSMAGYRIGPFEIESVLAQHPAVAECSVIGAPDEVRGEVIEAYVVLRDGSQGSPELASELQQLVKTRYAAHAYPRTVRFLDALPKTPSGKIQRYLLRQQRAGLTAEAR